MAADKKTAMIMTLLLLLFSLCIPQAFAEDVSKPVITQPFPNEFSDSSTPEIGALVTDDGGVNVATSSLAIDNGPELTGLSYNASTQRLSTKWPFPLPDGEHSATLKVYDQAGNEGVLSWKFIVDTAPPIINQNLPQEGQVLTFNTNKFPETIIYVSDANQVRSAKFYFDNVLDPGSLLIPWVPSPLVWIPSRSVTDGTHAARLEIEDFAGNVLVCNWIIKVEGAPSITGVSPIGTTTSFTPTIKAYIRDNSSGVDVNSIALSFDGGPEIKVGNYYTNFLLNYSVTPPFSNQRHTVTLKAKCKNGHETVKTWEFWYDSQPPSLVKTVLFNYPEYLGILTETTVTNQMNLIKGSNLWFAFATSEELVSFTVDVDGSKYSGRNTSNLVGWPAKQAWTIDYQTLADGPHKMVVNMIDAGQNTQTETIYFNVMEAPKIEQESPPNLAKGALPSGTVYEITDPRRQVVLNTSRPNISAKITDNSSIDASNILFVLDGKSLPFVYDTETHLLTFAPVGDLENETLHNVKITATDPAGNKSETEIQFYINTYPEMPWDSNQTCINCHLESSSVHLALNGSIERGTKCSYCHSSFRAIQDKCIACHKFLWHEAVTPEGSFHEVAFTDKTGIPSLELDNIHRAETGSCNQCHAKSINREHARTGRTNVNGNVINCDTCHVSVNATVTAAISNRQTNCTSCHTESGGNHEAVHSTGLDDNCTKVCHKSNLVQEHLQNPQTQMILGKCETCHSSQKPEVVRAIVEHKGSCVNCHDAAHNFIITKKLDGEIPLMSSLKWSTPMPALTFSGAIPSGLEQGYMVTSNSAGTINGQDVLTYYKGKMAEYQWIQVSPEPQNLDNYQVNYKKGDRTAVLSFSSVPNQVKQLYRVVVFFN